ncbi:MAG TPA: GH1 family beta-glucosidase [Streptosporangiaceae bacterium]|jgi:beta-glucosidase|nr:GH1 family beta-glucosidase [Streptosporangiaceae bacterium]
MNDLSELPDSFTWGVATSAYQIEGAVAEDGRSPSIWDTFSHTPGKVAGGDTGDVACDSYHRWPEDVGLMKELGVGAYRFSIAWPRIMPGGGGPVNPAGLAYYDRLVDTLLAAGITPYPTLYHWDLPQALQDHGGWASRDTAHCLAEYASVVAGRLGDRVTNWVTLNEPRCAAWIGHLEGRHAPGLADIDVAVPVSFHLLLGHGLAAQAVRAAAPGARVGLVNVLHTCEPASDTAADVEASARFDGHVNRWWLDPIHGRGFPADMQRVYGVDLPEKPGDLDTIAAPLDFLGANYYSPAIIADDPGGPVPYARDVPPDGVPQTMLNWEIRAAGLEQVLVRLATEYGAREVYVTENGSAWADRPTPDGQVHDEDRLRYLEEHLAACGRAVRRGVPLTGYFAWSLLDNFEWDYGYDARFGLVYVDYATQQRMMKDSGRRYAQIIAAHGQRAPVAI